MPSPSINVITKRIHRRTSMVVEFMCLVLMLNMSVAFKQQDLQYISKQGQKVLFCSRGGYRWVSLSDLTIDGSPENKQQHCDLCVNLVETTVGSGRLSTVNTFPIFTDLCFSAFYAPEFTSVWPQRELARAPPRSI